MNGMLRSNLKHTAHLRHMALPVHTPIQVTLNYVPKPLPILVQPAPLPVSGKLEPEVDLTDAFLDMQATFEQHLLNGCLTDAYALWSQYWEGWIIRQLEGDFDHPRYRGRGQPPRYKTVMPRSPRKPSMTDAEARVANFLGRLAEYNRLSHKQTDYAVTLLDKVTKQASDLMLIYGPPMPSEDGVLKQLEAHFFQVKTRLRAQATTRARQIWKAKLCQPRGLNRSLAQTVRADSDKLLREVQIPGREPALSLEEITEQLTTYWDGIHQLPEEDAQVWMRQYDAFLPRVEPFELPPISAEEIQDRLAKMKLHTAKGADGWNLQEMRSLPLSALQQLAMLYSAAEVHAKWPQLFNVVYTAVLQKTSSPGPKDIRPIGITPIAYRIWSALRFQHLQRWAEQLYPEGLTAYRHGVDLQKDNLRKAVVFDGPTSVGLRNVFIPKGSFHQNVHFLEVLEMLEILDILQRVGNKGGIPPSFRDSRDFSKNALLATVSPHDAFAAPLARPYR